MATDEQAMELAFLEQVHGQIQRLPDESPPAEEVLSNCVSDTRAYVCRNCSMVLSIEPDGTSEAWFYLGGEEGDAESDAPD